MYIHTYLVGFELDGAAHFLKREKALINVRELGIILSQKEGIQHMHPEHLCATTTKQKNSTYAHRAECANSA